MAGFNLPFGPMDSTSLPALLRQQMASPGLISGPVPPVQLTSGFHPPGGGMGGMSTPQPDPGFNVKDGLALLREGLGRFLPMVAGGPTAPDPTKPGVPTPQGDPTGGAGPAFLGGVTSLGADPNALLMRMDPLTGLPLLNSSWENFRG